MTTTTEEAKCLQEPGITLEDALRGLEWEAEHGVLDTGRYRMAYARWGTGHPLIFVHGLADSLVSSALTMAHLARDYTCIAYKQPSGDDDGANLKTYRHQHLVDDLFALMNHLKLMQATLVGHSFGTTIALEALGQRPFRVCRAMLVCGFAHRPLARSEWWLSQLGRRLPGRLSALPLRDSLMRQAHGRAFQRQPASVWDFYLNESGKAPCHSIAHWALELHKIDLRPRLPTIQQPVLVVSAEYDPLVPSLHQDYLFKHLPNATLLRMHDCGHFPLLTHPEAMVDAIRRFAQSSNCPLHTGGEGCGHPAETPAHA